MAEKSERIAAQVEPGKKQDFQIAAMRRQMSEAELLRQLVDEFLAEEDIPEEVRKYLLQELEDDPNRSRPQAQTAD
jgi:hypothetical protein